MGITKADPSQYGHLRSSEQPQSSARKAASHSETLRFRTPEPILYPEQAESSGLRLDVSLICEGECEWETCDDALFGKNCVPGAELNEHLENELCLALNAALVKLSRTGVPYAELPGRSDEVGASLAEDLFPLWRDRLGIQAIRFRLTSVVPQKSEDAKAPAELTLGAERGDPAAQALSDAQPAAANGGWVCPQCGAANRDNFCSMCGLKKPE